MRTVRNSTYVNCEKMEIMGKGLSNWEDKDGIYHEDELHLTHKIGEKVLIPINQKLLPTEEVKKFLQRYSRYIQYVLPDVKSWTRNLQNQF